MNTIAIGVHQARQIQYTWLDLFDRLRLLYPRGPLDPPRPYDPPGLPIPRVSQEPKLNQAL